MIPLPDFFFHYIFNLTFLHCGLIAKGITYTITKYIGTVVVLSYPTCAMDLESMIMPHDAVFGSDCDVLEIFFHHSAFHQKVPSSFSLLDTSTVLKMFFHHSACLTLQSSAL